MHVGVGVTARVVLLLVQDISVRGLNVPEIQQEIVYNRVLKVLTRPRGGQGISLARLGLRERGGRRVEEGGPARVYAVL